MSTQQKGFEVKLFVFFVAIILLVEEQMWKNAFFKHRYLRFPEFILYISVPSTYQMLRNTHKNNYSIRKQRKKIKFNTTWKRKLQSH